MPLLRNIALLATLFALAQAGQIEGENKETVSVFCKLQPSSPPASIYSHLLAEHVPTCRVLTTNEEYHARAAYDDSVNEDGWSKLRVSTSPLPFSLTTGIPPAVSALISSECAGETSAQLCFSLASASIQSYLRSFAAGYAEGVLTHAKIWAFYLNYFEYNYDDSFHPPPQVGQFFESNMKYTVDVINSKTSGVDKRIREGAAHTFAMLEGMAAALKEMCEPDSDMDGKKPSDYSGKERCRALSFSHLFHLNGQGDLGVVQQITNTTKYSQEYESDEAVRATLRQTEHCSCVVRVTDDLSNLFVGHNMWWQYYAMVRIFKYYSFAHLDGARTVAFSSYPALLSSTDDYYQNSNGMVVMETTNHVYSHRLLSEVVPNTILTWIRASTASRLAGSGEEWLDVFTQVNSGTYNNMWILVNFNRFEPYTGMSNGTLWIVEQMPGFFVQQDVTMYLELGYWASFNRPFSRRVFEESGYADMEKKYGLYYSHDETARSKIFRRDHTKVIDITSLKAFMRYNDWQNDPFSGGNAEDQIAARYDLIEGKLPPLHDPRMAGGAIDAKVVAYSDVMEGKTHIISGPTHSVQPPFVWTEEWAKSMPNRGQPRHFAFDWIEVEERMLSEV
mmetsp:Transcript_28081/g.71581  ORF Transcript_28081/g.71581 Transcript_28081/m.71581 type:complete len:618 (-) Transcript_28081:213-2066(-)